MSRVVLAAGPGVLILLVACGTSCQRPEDPVVLQQRQKLILTAEPKGALGVVEAREVATTEPQPMVLVGRIGVGPGVTWDPSKAAFVVADLKSSPEEWAHAHSTDGDQCPFCQAKAEQRTQQTALIEVVDETGSVIPIDARRLLAVEDYQTVVVRGLGRIDALGNLIVSADGIYRRR